MVEWEELIPEPNSEFLRVKCLECGNEQMVFGYAVNKVDCNVCGAELVIPSGGRATIKGETIKVFK